MHLFTADNSIVCLFSLHIETIEQNVHIFSKMGHLHITMARWIGWRVFVEYPARSTDLTPVDFFEWGYLKVSGAAAHST